MAPNNSATRFTSFILDFVREAGALGLKTQQTAARQFKADKSIVTEADLAISNLFHKKIASLSDAADHFVIDEENCGTVAAARDKLSAARYVWTLDPIDGTMPFANQMPFWGVLVSVYEHGQPLAAAIYLPALGDLIYTDGDAVMYERQGQQAQPLQRAPAPPLESKVPVFASTGFVTSVSSEVRAQTHFLKLHSAAVYAAFALLGRVRASFFGPGMSIWDVSAAIVIAGKLGMPLTMLAGQRPVTTLDLNLLKPDWKWQDHVLLSLPEYHNHFLAYLPRDTAAEVA